MPKMITMATTVVVRDGQRIYPELNKVFNYTAEEIKTINGLHPGGVRKPVNEDPDVDSGTAGSGEISDAEGAAESAPEGTTETTDADEDDDI